MNEYQKKAKFFIGDSHRNLNDWSLALHACLGMAGETGETIDILKKCIFQGKVYDNEVAMHLRKEIGDTMWYIAELCTAMGFDLDDICDMNIEKLKARYPNGFTVEAANNRKAGDI